MFSIYAGERYPHIEGTWPNTMDALRATFGAYPENEIRSILGTNAMGVLGFDPQVVGPIGERVGPALSDIVGEVRRT